MFAALKVIKDWRGALLAAWLGVSFIASPLLIDAAQPNSAKDRMVPARADPAPKPAQSDPYDIRFKEFRLKNGLRVLLSEDHRAPTYSICVTYNVGSRDEKPGR